MSTLDHVGIYVKDLVKSVVFYGEVFGFQVARTMETSTSKIAFLDVGGSTLELIERPGAPGKTEARGATPPSRSMTTTPWSRSSKTWALSSGR